MLTSRTTVLLLLSLGLASTAAFHAGGALDERDALTAATLWEGVPGSPPAPVTSRLLGLGVRVARLVVPDAGLFRAMHLAAGFLLTIAAALSGLVAARAARRPGGAGLAAGLLVGTACLFGADFGRLGLAGSPLAPLLALLAGAAASWASAKPLPFLGGLLLGIATAEHPAVLFLLPGYGALAIGATLRSPVADGARIAGRQFLGFALGLGALLLPLLDSGGSPPIDVGDPSSIAGALSAWWGNGSSAFWSAHGLASWPSGFASLWSGLARNAGFVGLVLGVAGGIAFFFGDARLARPFLLVHLVPAIALVAGRARDETILVSLASWAFLFWSVPAVVELTKRLAPPRRVVVAPALAVLSALILLGTNRGEIDRSAERSADWASNSLAHLPLETVFFTANPVHAALSADGLRSDVHVVYVDEATSLRPRGSTPPLELPAIRGRRLTDETIAEIISLNLDSRPVAFAPSLYFEPERRAAILGNRWGIHPRGLAHRVAPIGTKPGPTEARRSSGLWAAFDMESKLPASDLRGGLSGEEFYARGLLQSAANFLELGLKEDAEREFLFGISLPKANRTIAAYGLARVLYSWNTFEEAAAVIETFTNESDPGAWNAYHLLGTTYIRLGKREEGLEELRRAIRLVPPGMPEVKDSLEGSLKTFERGAVLPPRNPAVRLATEDSFFSDQP